MRPNIDIRKDVEGQLYDQLASTTSRFRWSGLESDVILQGGSDLAILRSIRNAIINLQQEFTSEQGPSIKFDAQRRDDYSKRLLLLEGEVDGLLRKRINYTAGDQATGERVLDYSNILNEKENQVVQLQRKINNLQERLRRASARQIELQNHIENLTRQLQVKQNIIKAKNEIILAEVGSSNAIRESIIRLKKNLDINKSRIGDLDRIILEGVTIPEVGGFQIKAETLTKDGAQSRSKTYAESADDQKLKTKVIQLVREFERLFGQKGVTQEQVQRAIEGFLTQFRGSRLYSDVETTQRRIKAQEDLIRLKQNFAAAASIYQQGLQELKIANPGIRVNMQKNIFDILQRQKVQAYRTEKGALFVSDYSQRTVQVPVQDARTKHLLHLFASELKRLFIKYPKLQGEINERVAEFFQQEIIDLIQTDEVDRLVEIVKYRPQVVKVENVYAYSSEKSRKVQFHLRVLIKALLEELQKMKAKTGIIPDMDQGVVGMIKQEIMGVVNVDDILKVFRVVPKIVQVQKVVQKVVQKIVQVPQIVTIDRIVQRIVQVQKIKQVQKIVNVPLQQPVVYDRLVQKVVPIQNITERVVEVPTIVQRIVQVQKEVPKIVQIDRIVQKQVQVQRIVEVERVVNHIEKQYEQIELVQQKIVPVQKIIEKIVQVPVYVQKIVQKIVEKPKIIQVQKVIQKLVPVVQYRNAKQVVNHIEIQHQIVQRIVQKPVPIIQTVQRIVEVPQIVQKIVTVTNIQTRIQQVEVIRQKIVIEQKIKQVQKIVTQIVEVIKQVPREIQRIVEVPVIHERIVTVQQFIEKPIIQKIENTIIKQVYLREPLVIKQPKIVQVQKIINHFIDVPKPFKYIEQKIVQVPRIVDRIKQVRVQIDKLVQKMVQVPKVVQVEKIVQKIVVVPRVIEKVVQIPQIVQKVVQKQVIRQIIRQVQRKIEVPVIQQKPYEVQVQKNVFIQVQKIVQRLVDKLVQVPRYQQTIQIRQIIQQKVIQIVKQIPRIIQVQKIVTLFVDQVQLIQIQKPVITPVQVPVPVDRIVQKLVIKQDIVQRVLQVPQVIQKIVTVKQTQAIIHEIQKIVQKVVIDQRIKQVQRVIPYIQQVIKQIPTIVQKIVPVQSTVQQIITAQQIVQKVIQKTVTVPKIYQTQRLRQVMVQVPKFIQIQRIVPQLVRVNNYVQKIVQKIVQVPMIIQQLKQIQKQVQKVVKIQHNSKQIIQVQKQIQKIVVMQKMKQVVRNVNHIQKVLQIVDRLQQIAPVQITARQEILVQVPYILQKIVQKIVIMPQIVQVLKYVHQITQVQDIGVAVDIQTSTYQQRYRGLSKNIKTQLDVLIKQLRTLRNPQFNTRIDIIQKFLAEFDKFILNPRIIKVPHKQIVQRQVQKQRIVTIPTQDQKSIRMQLTLSLLVQKLILQLKRIRQTAKIDLQLDQDIKLIFFADLKVSSQLEGALAQQLQAYSSRTMRQFESLGNWSLQHQFMLNSFLQERFLMAEIVHNANLQIQRAQATGQKRLQGLRRYKKDRSTYQGYLQQINQRINGLSAQVKAQLSGVIQILGQFQNYSNSDGQLQLQEQTQYLGALQLQVQDIRIQSMLRQKQQQIYRLKDLLTKSGLHIQGKIGGRNILQQLNRIKLQNGELRATIRSLQARIGSSDIDTQIAPFKQQIKQLQQLNLSIQAINSQLTSNVINLKAQNKVLRQLSGDTRISDSGIRGGDINMSGISNSGFGLGSGSNSGSLNVTPSQQDKYRGQQQSGYSGNYGSTSGIQGATITTSSLRPTANLQQSMLRSPQSLIKSPETTKQFQSPSRTAIGQSRYEQSSYDMGQGSRVSSQGLGTPQQGQYSTAQQGQYTTGQQGQYSTTQQGQGQGQYSTTQQGQYTSIQPTQQGQGQYTTQGFSQQGFSQQGSQFQSTPGSTNKQDSGKKEEPKTGGNQYQPYRRY